MKRKIIGIFVMTLLIATSTFQVAGISDVEERNNTFYVSDKICKSDFPDDFNLDVHSGGFSPVRKLFRIQINMDGEVTYSVMYPEDRDARDWTIVSQFDFTESEMNQIWNNISSNDFFNLNNLYKNENIMDGTYAEMTITGDDDTNTVRTENIPVVQFDNIVKTVNSITQGNNDLFYNAIFNYRPDQPSKPSGQTSGKPGEEYTYTSTTSDYNSDQIYYLFNWGDGTDSDWTGPYGSGETGSAKHIWTNQGNYNITVKAKDDPNGDGDLSDGKESIWSEPLPATMPKSKISKLHFVNLLIRLKQQFPMLNILNRFYQGFLPFNTPATSNVDGGTRVSIKDCEITVNIYIQIRGPCATVQVAKDIEQNIEDVWNGDWMVKCEEDCDPRDPGCSVEFDAHVVRMDDMHSLPGFHDIEIVCDNSADGDGHVSSVQGSRGAANDRVLDDPRPNDGGTTTGSWDTNEPANTYAHEAGHLMGLDDTYPPHQDEDDYDDHIMDDNGAVMQEDIDLIIEMSGIECPCDCCPEEEDNEEPETDIDSPQDGSSTSNPINIEGSASDIGGSGIAELDYKLEWVNGFYEGGSYPIDPPIEETGFMLGPIYLENYIEIGDWIKITVYAIDAADNIGSDSVTVTWEEEEEDTTPPVTEKTIGEPQWEEGYNIASFTPILLEATDPEPGSGVHYIHYEVWQDGIMKGSEDILSDTVEMTFGMYEVFTGIAELRWYAVDNAENVENMHYQEHFVLY